MSPEREFASTPWIENMEAQKVKYLPQDVQDKLARMVDELPKELRDVVEAIEWERLSFREAADKLGYPAHSMVWYRYTKAIRIMREQLEDDRRTN